MKKVIFTLALAAFAFTGNAQILKKDLLQGYIVRKRRQLP